MTRLFSAFRSLRVRVLTGTAVLAIAAFVCAANVDARSSVDRAKEWASTHHVAIAAMSLEEYAAYPEDYKHAILDEITPEDHSRLWQTQLSLVLKNEPALTATQRTFITQTMAEATPESFVPGAAHPEICADIAAIFPDTRLRKQVVTLGSAVTPVATWRPFLISVSERVRSSIVADAVINYCNCRGLGLCECSLFAGCQDSPGCQQTNQCGCLWLGPCDEKLCTSIFTDMMMVKAPSSTAK